MAPLKAQNYITLMEGTENQKSFYLQNPSQPTEDDILKIKKAYGIDPDTTLDQTRDLLNKLEAGEIKSPLATLPEGPAGFGQLYEVAADVAERAELIKDPLQYYGNTFLPIDGLISEPSFSMSGGFLGVTAAQSAKIAATRNPFAVLTPGEFLVAEGAGSDIGTKVYRLGNNIIRSLMDLPEDDLATQTSQALYDTSLNIMFTGGAMTMAPIFNAGKATIGKYIFGVSPDKANLEKIAQISETYGMPMGLIQASNMPFWKGYSKVIGVFPWIGSAFKRQAQAVDEGSRQYLGSLANSMAPMQTMTMLGADFQKIMGKNYDAVRATHQYMYENFEEYAKKLAGKKVINISGFKEVAKDTAAQFKEAIPGMQGYGEFRFPGDGTKRAFGQFYETMSKLDENITLDQAVTMRQMFNDFITNFKTEFKGTIPREEAQAIGNLAARLEYDILNLKNIDNAVDETVFNTAIAKLAAANEYFAFTMPTFQGGVAANMKQVNSNIFGPGPDVERGLMYTDEMFKIIFGRAKTSNDAMKHLIELSQTTPDQIRAYNKAGRVEGKVVDIETLVKDMDINSPTYGQMIKKTVPIISAAPDAGRKKIVRKLFDDAIEASIEGLPPGVSATQFINLKDVAPEVIRAKGLKKAAPELLEFSDVRFNPSNFAKSLGLDTKEGQEILATALEGTGVSVKGVQRFLDAVSQAKSFEINDSSTFLQRRLTLTGLKGLMLFGAGTGAASTVSGPFSPVLTALVLKYGSSILSNPKYLKTFTELYENMAKNPGDLDKALTLSRRNDILEWASTVLPTDEEVERQEFINSIDESIFSLMQKGQTKIEAENAREQQLNMMSGNINKAQQRVTGELLNRINRTLQPISGEETTPSFTPTTSFFNPRSPLNNQVRNELAFGTLDDAIAAQGGIGNL